MVFSDIVESLLILVNIFILWGRGNVLFFFLRAASAVSGGGLIGDSEAETFAARVQISVVFLLLVCLGFTWNNISLKRGGKKIY